MKKTLAKPDIRLSLCGWPNPFVARVLYQPKSKKHNPNHWQIGWVFITGSKGMANSILKRIIEKDTKYRYRLEQVLEGDFDWPNPENAKQPVNIPPVIIPPLLNPWKIVHPKSTDYQLGR